MKITDGTVCDPQTARPYFNNAQYFIANSTKILERQQPLQPCYIGSILQIMQWLICYYFYFFYLSACISPYNKSSFILAHSWCVYNSPLKQTTVLCARYFCSKKFFALKRFSWENPYFRAAEARLFQQRWAFNSKNSPRSVHFTKVARAIACLARASFFFNALKRFFVEKTLILGLPRHVFSSKDEPLTQKTRPTAFILLK